MKKEQIFADFSKEWTLYRNSYHKKEEGRPYTFAQVSVQKIRETDTKGVDSQKVRVSNSPNVFTNTIKKS